MNEPYDALNATYDLYDFSNISNNSSNITNTTKDYFVVDVAVLSSIGFLCFLACAISFFLVSPCSQVSLVQANKIFLAPFLVLPFFYVAFSFFKQNFFLSFFFFLSVTFSNVLFFDCVSWFCFFKQSFFSLFPLPYFCRFSFSDYLLLKIYQHVNNYTRPTQQRYIVRIIVMVPIYAVLSYISLFFYEYQTYFAIFRDW